MNCAIDKASMKERMIQRLFLGRIKKAKKEYREAVKGTPYETQCVHYRNNTFNPLDIKPRDITGVYQIDEGSEHGKALNRLIRVMDSIKETEGHLVYILNFVERVGEFEYILGESTKEPTRKEECDEFKVTAEDKLKVIRRLKLLAEVA